MSDGPSPVKAARPRPIFLVLGGAVLAVLLVYKVWPAASPGSGPSNPPRQDRTAGPAGQASKKGGTEFDVRLGELQQPPPEPDQSERNPFRFKPKPPPPPPAPPKLVNTPPPTPVRIPQPGEPDYVAPAPPPPPPIPLKFIGTMEQGTTRVAIFSDGKGMPQYAAEGKTVLGQYRVVKIGVESVVMEYLDGRGRQTIPMRGGSQ